MACGPHHTVKTSGKQLRMFPISSASSKSGRALYCSKWQAQNAESHRISTESKIHVNTLLTSLHHCNQLLVHKSVFWTRLTKYPYLWGDVQQLSPAPNPRMTYTTAASKLGSLMPPTMQCLLITWFNSPTGTKAIRVDSSPKCPKFSNCQSWTFKRVLHVLQLKSDIQGV